MGNGECYKRLADALRTLQMIQNALTTLPMACECSRKLTAKDSIRWTLGNASYIVTLMLLSHIGEYASEYESLKFSVNSPKKYE